MYHIDKAHNFSVLEGHIPLKAQTLLKTALTRHEGGVIKGMKLTWQLAKEINKATSHHLTQSSFLNNGTSTNSVWLIHSIVHNLSQ